MLLSFIVPVYNTEKYLEECLESIMNQTCKDFEVIVINDGSTDNSEAILKKYEEKYAGQLSIIRQENHGIGYTRNKGIHLASGKYITFIDSDDSIEPSYCEKMCGEAEKDQLDLVICDYYEKYEQSGEKKYVKSGDFSVSNLKEDPRLLFEINSSPWNKIYRTDLLKENAIVFPEKLKYEDAVFVLKCMANCERIGKVNEALVNYLIREGSETTVMNPRVFEIFPVLDEICQYFQKSHMYETVKEYLEWFCINRISVYHIQQRFQPDQNDADRFIDMGYAYLNRNFPDWRKNAQYIQNNSPGKRLLKSNKGVMKLFVKMTRKAK